MARQLKIRLRGALYYQAQYLPLGLPAFMLGAIEPIPLVGLTVKNIPSSPPRFEWPIRRRFSSRTTTSAG